MVRRPPFAAAVCLAAVVAAGFPFAPGLWAARARAGTVQEAAGPARPGPLVPGAAAGGKAREAVVRSARALAKGHILAGGDLEVVELERAHVPPGALRDAGAAAGRVLGRAVGAGVILREEMLADGSVVKRGRRVTLVAEGATLRIAAPGETLENARIGGPVKAVNLTSRRTVAGRLVDEDTVRVEY